jgi:peptidoglycan/xylan/chitin deacetylase (PgdA/CDA1 family)
MRRFLVCLHDATPAFMAETSRMLRDLAPLVERRVSIGVVPDWHAEWPLASHPDYCRLLRESSEELLLHGCFHRRARGLGPVTVLAEGSDEMNGLDPAATRRLVERGQRALAEAFGEPARGFLAPAWQRGRVRAGDEAAPGIDHVLGFFCLESNSGTRVPLATATWDCGRWSSLGHVGDAVGRTLRQLERRVPVLAVHPRDVTRGYWPGILRLTGSLLDSGYEPVTAARLLESRC